MFSAAVAARLSALPSPYPCLAVTRVVLPDVPAIRQTYGDGIADQLLERLYTSIRKFAPDCIIGASADGRIMLTYEYDPDWTDLHEVAADLRAAISESRRGNWLSFSAPCSIGSARFSGEIARGASIDVADELIRQADLAAELAVEHGDNGFLLYTVEEDARIRRATVLDQLLRDAITRNEFTLHYQPLVDLQTFEMVSLEALIRWNSPSTGVCSPDEFIPAAEKSGLIIQIGAMVIEAAIRQVSAWKRVGWQPPRVAVNVSSAQLLNADFCGMLMGALAREGVDPSRIELEVTERTLITAPAAARALLEGLRASGISVALDDFGVGYSSLQYLRDLPISKLKIDRSFVLDVGENDRSRALIKSIVSLGTALDLEVVAEGIETEIQAAALLDCGCRLGQGYLFSRPKPPSFIQGISEDLRSRVRPILSY
jgi:EAL domain-containing protein (putative c-di-GMP-specific phosphodiesterase class I)/GGDEF domain-containing protein